MKKINRIIAALLSAVMLLGCAACNPQGGDSKQDSQTQPAGYCSHQFEKTGEDPATCTAQGIAYYTCTLCGKVKKEAIDITAHKPIIEDPDDYITPCKCEYCGNYVQRESEHVYDDEFVVTLTQEIIDENTKVYDALNEAIAAAEKYDPDKHGFVKDSDQYNKNKDFEHNFYDPFSDTLDYAIEQYQYSYVFYCVNDNKEWEEKFDLASDYYNEQIERYYTLFRPIYETEYRDYFFSEEDGWTEDDIRRALDMSDTYAEGRAAELRKKADDITMAFREISDAANSGKVLTLYAEFVETNQELAKLFGYDNYMEYAYDVVYERDYTPADTRKMSDLVKNYLGGSFFTDFYSYCSKNVTNTYAYCSMISADASVSVFNSKDAFPLIAEYFATLKKDDSKTPIDFKAELNKMLRDGNYYTGKGEHAFSYHLSTKDNTILYFGPGSYSSPFTMVHEFGHYMNNIYNHGANLPLDLDETQSQGNEMLFIGFLKDWVSEKGHPESYTQTVLSQLENAMIYILLATAVDEFEQVVYTGKYYGSNTTAKNIVADGQVTLDEYDKLFEAICTPYGIDTLLNMAYWRYVVIESPCYYISYAMSLLPSVQILLKADAEGFEAAKESYLKLFTFTDEPTMAHRDIEDNIIFDGTYDDVLKYAGLNNPFEKASYTKLVSFLKELGFESKMGK